MDDPARERVLLHMPVDVRSVALVVIAVLLSVFAMQWAKAVLIPVLLGLVMSYALTPAVDFLRRWRVPRAAAAGLVLASIVGAACWGAWSLSDQANALVQSLPGVAEKLHRLTVGGPEGAPSAIAKVQQAAVELEKVVQGSPSGSAPAAPSADSPRQAPGQAAGESAGRRASAAQAAGTATRVIVVSPGLNIRDYLWTGTLGAVAALGQTAIVLSIALFLLASGDSFRRKMVKLAGPKLSQKKVTVQVLDEITGQIQRYLLVQLLVSVIVGVLTGLAFYAIGLEQAAAWGVVAGLTNLVPYVGALATTVGAAVFAVAQFGTVEMAMIVGGSSLAIHAVVGNILTPWWMGRMSRISPIVVFVSLLVFGWMWGIWGLLLGVPMLMATKAVCDRIEDLQPIGELLGA